MSRPQRVDGYLCEVVARSPDAGGEWYLATAWADCPAEALSWLYEQADRLADVLDLVLTDQSELQAQYTSSIADVMRSWRRDIGFGTVQHAALARGRTISANARGADRICGAEVEVFYSLVARPVVHPLLHR